LRMRKLGLIAGGGGLPLEVLRACEAAGRPVFVVRLKGMADPALSQAYGVDLGLTEVGKVFKALKAAHCGAVCLAGQVAKPDFATLKPDLRGIASLPALAAAARKGDDALLRHIVGMFEQAGFAVEGADQVVRGLTIEEGALGRWAPREE